MSKQTLCQHDALSLVSAVSLQLLGNLPTWTHLNTAPIAAALEEAGSQAGSARPCLGIDVGGTFTDLALCIDDGALLCLKVASSPERPGFSTLQGVDELCQLAGIAKADWRPPSATPTATRWR